MAQTGYSKVQIYSSSTATHTPSAGNLTNDTNGSELAINITDGKLFYKDNSGTVQVLATKGAGTIGGSNTQVQYNSSGTFAGSANLTFDGTTLTSSGFSGPLNGTVGATTANTGAFTTLSASSTVSGTGFSTYLASPPAIGGTAPNTGKFTTLTSTSDATIHGLTVGQGGGSVSTNTAVGASALVINTGTYNCAVGYQTLSGNTSGTENASVGWLSLNANTTGSYSTALGAAALFQNTTGSNNTAIGDRSLFSNTTASNNTAVGYQAGYSNNANASGAFFGYQAGYSSTGDNNTFIGAFAGYSVTGAKNTILGRYNGNMNGLDIRTASNYIVLSDGDGNPRGYWDANGNFLTKSAGSAGSYNSFQTQNGAGTALFTVRDDGRIATGGAASPYNNTSASVANMYVDSNGIFYRGGVSALKYKTNVRDLPSIDISKFRPVVYNSLCEIDNKQQDYFGFIADEVDSAGYKELVIYGEQGEVEGFQYERMTAVLLKAIQELKAEFDAYKATHP